MPAPRTTIATTTAIPTVVLLGPEGCGVAGRRTLAGLERDGVAPGLLPREVPALGVLVREEVLAREEPVRAVLVRAVLVRGDGMYHLRSRGPEPGEVTATIRHSSL